MEFLVFLDPRDLKEKKVILVDQAHLEVRADPEKKEILADGASTVSLGLKEIKVTEALMDVTEILDQ